MAATVPRRGASADQMLLNSSVNGDDVTITISEEEEEEAVPRVMRSALSVNAEDGNAKRATTTAPAPAPAAASGGSTPPEGGDGAGGSYVSPRSPRAQPKKVRRVHFAE